MPAKHRSIAHDPLGESEIMKEFYRPSSAKPEKVSDSSNGEPPSPMLVKATFYLAPEDIIALEELQLAVRKREGRRANKSELMREAISLLVKSYEI